MYDTKYVQRIRYTGGRITRPSAHTMQSSIDVLGIDTEAYSDGKCFMIATSLGDVFEWEQFPDCMYGRKYRNKTFVAYNLSYDAGHFISWLPQEKILELWKHKKTVFGPYTVKTVPKKYLRITKNKKDSITFYDMLNFYRGAGTNGKSDLDSVAEKILGERKIHVSTKKFTRTYVKKHWVELANYCIQDAVLVERLGKRIIHQFEEWGVFPRSLYSTAYVTFQYFSRKTNYVTVERYWRQHRRLLDYAMQSYNGGKFEVTRKGPDYYYEYDIVSAYPYEISRLIDISTAIVKHRSVYDPDCTYCFVKCIIEVPPDVYSPVALKWGAVNIYPVGRYIKVLTKNEYEYMKTVGYTLHVIDGYFLYTANRTMPYRREILRLFEYKKKYKHDDNKLLYHTIKILLNSLYGKFVQIIKDEKYWKTSSCWNPIYGAIITANTRIRVSEMQQKYPSVVAVHTDSVISTKPLDINISNELGAWDYETEGEGVILGSGIYQVGDTSKYRGFRMRGSLMEFCNIQRSRKRIYGKKALSWREAIFRGYSPEMINRFIDDNKWLNVRFDKKRLWPEDYSTFAQALKRHSFSVPHLVDLLDSLEL